MVPARIAFTLLAAALFGAIIVAGNGLRHLGERQSHQGRSVSPEDRLRIAALSELDTIRPSVFGQAITILICVPVPTLTSVGRCLSSATASHGVSVLPGTHEGLASALVDARPMPCADATSS